jgi:hypothetical protein
MAMLFLLSLWGRLLDKQSESSVEFVAGKGGIHAVDLVLPVVEHRNFVGESSMIFMMIVLAWCAQTDGVSLVWDLNSNFKTKALGSVATGVGERDCFRPL